MSTGRSHRRGCGRLWADQGPQETPLHHHRSGDKTSNQISSKSNPISFPTGKSNVREPPLLHMSQTHVAELRNQTHLKTLPPAAGAPTAATSVSTAVATRVPPLPRRPALFMAWTCLWIEQPPFVCLPSGCMCPSFHGSAYSQDATRRLQHTSADALSSSSRDGNCPSPSSTM